MTTINSSRRRFLTHSCRLGLAATPVMSTVLGLSGISSAAAADNDYKALVCVLLAGGNDSFNMLVPNDSDSYAEYQSIRADLALPRDQLLGINPLNTAGAGYGLHPSMAEVQSLFNQGKVAMLANVGTLSAPVTLAELQAGTANVPLGLFSHSDQIEQWQTSLPDKRTAIGWGGRMADLLNADNPNNQISMNLSLEGSNIFQNGLSVTEHVLSSEGDGTVGIRGYGGDGLFARVGTNAIDSMLAQQYQNIFERVYAGRIRSAIDNQAFFKQAVATVAPLETSFAGDYFSQNLAMVAKSIAARSELGHRRQTYFITFGGWDHHDEVLNSQQTMLAAVSQGLNAFYDATVELGVADQVTTFTISDFGRTLTSNGKGSDHGWGGNQLIMGGAVNGGNLYGQYPALYNGNPLDTGRDRLIPTTSVDEYFAELALWFGVSVNELDTVLPNIRRFYSPQIGVSPIGFL